MSMPRSLVVPGGARSVTLESPFGPVAALRAEGVPVPGGTGTPVLLLPGFTGSKEDFLALLDPLRVRGFTVVGMDHRGQYQTQGPEDAGDDVYGLERLGAEALAVAALLGDEPVHVVGHSFGGLVAQSMALQDPTRIRSLTLLCSGPGALPRDQTEILDTFITGLPMVGKDTAWTVIRGRSAATSGDATSEVEAFVRTRFVSTTLGSLLAMARALRDAPDRIDEVAALGLPAHVVHGADDDAWPIPVQQDTARRLGAQLTVVPGGHSPNVDAPEDLAHALAGFFSVIEKLEGGSGEA
jgi:pimeloyl-ACP methyl ester carboxylesterase